MHQSSLGTVIMLAGPRLQGLWHTAWLPFLFLISCITMGYAMVVMESTLSARAFGRQREDKMLGSLSSVIGPLLLLFVLFRLGDIIVQGKTALLFGSGLLSVMFWIEMVLFTLPAIVLLSGRGKVSPGCMFRAAFMIILAGTLYRFDAYMVAFDPGPGWSYFPSIPETLITLGLVALEILVFITLVKKFPILSGTSPVAAEGK
jgi:Ni/Fe-hydrogenase subunit HybB-like protein